MPLPDLPAASKRPIDGDQALRHGALTIGQAILVSE